MKEVVADLTLENRLLKKKSDRGISLHRIHPPPIPPSRKGSA